MPRKNAAQGDGKDAGILLIDERTKAVMTDQPRHAQEAFREQIAKVHEVVPDRSRDDVALVLQYHEGNVDKAIQSFMEDGAKTVLNEWQSHGKKGKSANKRNKKKKRGPDLTQDEKPSGGDAAAAASASATAPPNKTGSASSTTQPGNNSSSAPPTSRPYMKQRPPSSQQPRQYQQPYNRRGGDRDGDYYRGRPHPRAHHGEGRGGDGGKPGRQQSANNAAANHIPADSGKQRPEKGHRSHHTSPLDDMVERLLPPPESQEKVHHIDSELHYQDAAKAKKLVAVLERSTKDLHRTSIALTRHKAMLQDKLEQSEKSIPKSFDELQRFLNERKLALTNEFLAVKREATELLEAREEQAKELERKTHRAAAMSEEQVLELRAEIKQFVSDRKVDEEIGKALRFTWNPDQLIELIKNFGEVIPIQHHYTNRRPSISSLSSINTISRTTSISEDPGPLSARSISLTESQDSTTMGKPLSPRPTSDMDMKAEVAEMAARLQRSMTQGRKGARNQTGQNPDNQNKGDKSQQPNRGQQPQQNQGQKGPHPNKQERNQNRQERPESQHGSRHQGQQGSKQGPYQGQRSQDQRPQGQRPQGQRPPGQGPRQGQQQQQQQRSGNEEQDGQRRENRYAKRRQNRKQKERRQQDADEVSNPQASNATSGPDDSKPEQKQVDERTNVNSNVPVSVPSAADTPQPSKEPEPVPVPMESLLEKQESNQNSVNDSHPKEDVIPPEKTEALHSSEVDSGKVNGEVKEKKHEPKMTNGPLIKNGDVNMNGEIKINGDVPHMNGDIGPDEAINADTEAPRPQREIKSRRSQKIEDIAKETTALNGVADVEPSG